MNTEQERCLTKLISGNSNMVLMDKEELFDYSIGYDDDPVLEFDQNLPEWLLEYAIKYYKLFNGLWGLAVASGMPGNGKDLLFNHISWVIKTAFPKKLMRDEKPRELFGLYDGIFNDLSLKEDLDRMREVSKGVKTLTERNELLAKAADDWVSSTGEVMLKNSVLYLTELWRYCSKRDPHNPMNKTMGGIFKMKRHMDLLTLGTIQLMSDIDRFTCIPFIDWEIKAYKSKVNPTGYVYLVYKCQYTGLRKGLINSDMPIDIIRLDGAQPVDYLGEPVTIIDAEYKGNKNEQKLLDAINSGIDTYEGLLAELKYRNTNVLSIMKSLYSTRIIRKQKPVINYGCWFRLYNSKSAPNIKTNV